MALTDEQVESIFLDHGWSFGERADMYIPAARAIEAEVRKADEALIQKLVEALDEATNYTGCESWSPSVTRECEAVVSAGRARLEGKP